MVLTPQTGRNRNPRHPLSLETHLGPHRISQTHQDDPLAILKLDGSSTPYGDHLPQTPIFLPIPKFCCLPNTNSSLQAADLAHNRVYFKFFHEKIRKAVKKPNVGEIYNTFKNAFPKTYKIFDFFLGKLSNQFGEGGEVWEENRRHDVGSRTKEELEGFVIGAKYW